MESLTRVEVGWIIDVLNDTAGDLYKNYPDDALARLRAENLENCARKLGVTADRGLKRIAVSYFN